MQRIKISKLHCKKKKHAMHTKCGVLRLSHLEHLIWREVTLGMCVLHQIGSSVCFPTNYSVFPTPSSVFPTNSVCFPTNFSVFSHSL